MQTITIPLCQADKTINGHFTYGKTDENYFMLSITNGNTNVTAVLSHQVVLDMAMCILSTMMTPEMVTTINAAINEFNIKNSASKEKAQKSSDVPWPPIGFHKTLEMFDTDKYEYEVTESARKTTTPPPKGEGWMALDWERDDFTDTVLWRRVKPEYNTKDLENGK